ncbi:MAG: tRNA dihydrouridine synthase DusB [Pseudomonadota bacterium]
MSLSPLNQPFKIGNLQSRNAVALAPMAGLTDVPFREVAWSLGAGYMVSEMVGSQPQLWDTGKSRQRRVPVRGVTPVAVQIAGTDPAAMAEAARRHVDDGVEVVDINFGCPAKKVCKKAAGSALLGNLPLIGEIVHAVSSAVPVPITAKTRTGLEPGDGLGIAAARLAAEAGAKLIVMHGRSRACRFKGAAEYASVAALKAALPVPVLVNGDINSLQQAKLALRQTGADGIMIGRGAIGQPWLLRELQGGAPLSLAQKWGIILDHVERMHEFYGEFSGLRIARKHISAYLRGFNLNARDALAVDSAQAQLDWLRWSADMALRNAS